MQWPSNVACNFSYHAPSSTTAANCACLYLLVHLFLAHPHQMLSVERHQMLSLMFNDVMQHNSCFWSNKSLENDQLRCFFSLFFFFFFEAKVTRKWCTNTKMHDWWWCLHTRPNASVSNVEVWMVKPLSAGCVNIVGACELLTRNKELTLCGIKTCV